MIPMLPMMNSMVPWCLFDLENRAKAPLGTCSSSRPVGVALVATIVDAANGRVVFNTGAPISGPMGTEKTDPPWVSYQAYYAKLPG